MDFFSNIKNKLKPSTIIVSFIIIFFSIIMLLEIINNIIDKVNEKKIEDTNPNTFFYSADKNISLEIAKKYELKQYKSTDNYLIELRNNINLNIFISKKDIMENRNLFETISADKRAYLAEFDSVTNISDINEITVNNDKEAYTYSFQYLDSNLKKAYYLQVIWIETEDGYFILDIELPVEYLNYYSNIITDTLAGFKY